MKYFGIYITTVVGLASIVACGDEGADELPRPLLESSAATSAECPNGGTKVVAGLDGNLNGTLEEAEIDGTELFCDGAPGEPGDPGDPGDVTLVRRTDEPAGANCANGGDRIDVGVDDDGNGTLDEAEIDASTWVCRGLPGDDAVALLTLTSSATEGCPNGGTRIQTGLDADASGTLEGLEITDDRTVCNGEDGERLLITVELEPPGGACPGGGRRIRTGIDENDDGALSEAETRENEVLCDPVRNLVVTTNLPTGDASCPSGGERIDAGLDLNGNDVLEASEVVSTSLVCNGANGVRTLVRRQAEAAGTNCAQGGSRLTSGPDLNGNLILDAVEIESTTYVCNGAPGTGGAEGSAVRLSGVPAGADCVRGGTRIETGIDTNANGSLDDGEVTSTSYVCNGRAAVALVDILREPAGVNCPEGGQLVRSGADANANGALDDAEVATETYVCTSVAQVDIGFVTTTLPNALQRSAYSTPIEGVGGIGGGYQWTLVGGALPTGLELELEGTPSTRIIGTPTVTGTFNFTVEVEDFFGNSATQAFTLVVEQILEITRFELPRLAQGTPYAVNLTAAGGAGTRTWSVVEGTLPAGLALATNGAISGTPTSDDGEFFVVEVADSVGATARAGLRIKGEQKYGAYCGDFVVASQDDLSVFELNGTTVTSTGTVIAGATVEVDCFEGIEFSPKRDFIAFQTEDSSLVADLILADLSAFPIVATYTLNDPLDSAEDVENFAFSSTGDFIAYIADDAGSAINELFVVDLRTMPPAAPVKVNTGVVTGGDVTTYAWVPGSNRLVYRSDEVTDEEYNLYLYDAVSAAQRVQLNGPLVSLGDVNTNFTISPTGDNVAYTSDEQVDGQVRLYLVDISGATPGPPVEYSEGFHPDGDVSTTTGDVAFSPNGRWLSYVGDADNLGEKIYVRDVLVGGPQTLISQDNASTSQFVTTVIWSPDGRRVAFYGDMEVNDDSELFVADTESPGSPIRMNPALPTSSDVNSISGDDFAWDPSGRYVVYNVDAPTPAFNEFWVTFLSDAGNPVRVIQGGPADDDSQSVRVSDTGDALFFTTEYTSTTETDLLRIAVNPTMRTLGTPIVVNDPLVPNQDVLTGVLLVDGGAGVFFRGDTRVDNETDGVVRAVSGGVVGARQPVNPQLGSTTLAVTAIRIQKE